MVKGINKKLLICQLISFVSISSSFLTFLEASEPPQGPYGVGAPITNLGPNAQRRWEERKAQEREGAPKNLGHNAYRNYNEAHKDDGVIVQSNLGSNSQRRLQKA
ncbi:MAG: hypothetical protein K0M45_02000 [Candidatus Paracaedibacteraceae bacterium]|nr:hypothetical protein [Candidatus Paracaedibacteraceae bacterium]